MTRKSRQYIQRHVMCYKNGGGAGGAGGGSGSGGGYKTEMDAMRERVKSTGKPAWNPESNEIFTDSLKTLEDYFDEVAKTFPKIRTSMGNAVVRFV